MLKNLAQLVTSLRATTSIKTKIEILQNNKQLLPLLDRIYDPNYKFHLRSASLKGKSGDFQNCPKVSTIDELMEILHERKVTGNDAIAAAEYFISRNAEYSELIRDILDKNLKVRIGSELIRRAGEVGASGIKCALGFSLSQANCQKYFNESLGNGDRWFISRKLDGIRAFLAVKADGQVELLSRRKIPIAGMNPEIKSALKPKQDGKEFVLDGELVLIDPESGRDKFSETVSIVKSLQPKPLAGLKYYAFDVLDDSKLFSERQVMLQEYVKLFDTDYFAVVQQSLISSFNQETLIDEATRLGYEGFIIRRDVQLKDGRSRDLLKLKPFEDAEFKVIGREIGSMRIVVDGKEVEEQLCLSLTVEHHGHPVKVGSGFSIQERRIFAQLPESDLLGSLITVQYQSESTAQNRKETSLRFPVFKHFHGRNRTE